MRPSEVVAPARDPWTSRHVSTHSNTSLFDSVGISSRLPLLLLLFFFCSSSTPLPSLRSSKGLAYAYLPHAYMPFSLAWAIASSCPLPAQFTKSCHDAAAAADNDDDDDDDDCPSCRPSHLSQVSFRKSALASYWPPVVCLFIATKLKRYKGGSARYKLTQGWLAGCLSHTSG